MRISTTGATRTNLIGRAGECSAIEVAIATVTHGRPSVVIIEGGWGTGKSALLEHARDVALGGGVRVVSVRATRPASTDDDSLSMVELLLDRLQAPSASADRSLVRTVSAAASEAPLVMIVDDAHDLDAVSAQALEQVLASFDGLAVAMVLAGRPQSAPAWDAVRSAAARFPGSRFLRLAPLDHESAVSLMHDHLGGSLDGEQIYAAYEASGGNLLLIHACIQLLRGGIKPTAACPSDVPDALRHATRAFLHDLDSPTRSLVETAAVAVFVREADGPIFDQAIVGVAGLDPDEAALAIDHLVDVGVLATRDLQFVAPLAALAVISTLAGSRREQIHSALANALWSAGAPSSRVVEHLQHTAPGSSAWAVGMLRSAAAEADARGDRLKAVALLRRALDEWSVDAVRASLLAELARAEAAAGLPEAVESIERAAALKADPDRRCELLYAAGRSLLAAGRSRDAATIFQRGLRQRAGGGWPLLFRSALGDAARLYPRLRASVQSTIDDGPVLEGHPLDDGLRAALANRAFEMALSNEPAGEVTAIARRALPPVESAHVDDPALLTAAGALIFAGAIEPVRAAVDAALERVGVDVVAQVPGIRFRRGQCLAYVGELSGAYDDLLFAASTHLHGWAQHAIAAQANLARVQIAMGDLDLADAHLERALSMPSAAESTQTAELYEARGRLRLWQGRYKEALADYREAGRRAAEVFVCNNPSMLPWRTGAAFAANRLEAPSAALRLVEDELTAARQFGEPRAIAHSLRISGLIRRGDPGIDLLYEALEVVASSNARLEHAYVLSDLGGALRRSGRLRDAREHLRAAADLADRVGARGLAEHVAGSLRLAGARPRRARVTGPLALTPSELRVAQRARDGATNREIANELYVTPKAIEYHLGNAYRKLGIRSRKQLAAALAEDGVTPPSSR